MDAISMKRCCKCWSYLPLNKFNHDGTTSDNLTYRCRDCTDTQNTFIPTHPTDPDAIYP